MENDDDVLEFFCKKCTRIFVSVNIILFVEAAESQEQLMKLCLFCNTEIRVHTPVVLYYDNSYDEQLEIYFYSGKHS